MWLAQTRSSVADGWYYQVVKADPLSDVYGEIYDNADSFADQSAYPSYPAALRITRMSEDVDIQSGDYLELSYDSSHTIYVYPPPLSGNVDVYYYIGMDGATYNDLELCNPAKLVPTSTPTPTATPTPSVTPTTTPSVPPTPTPSVTPTPSLTPTPSVTPSPTMMPTPSVTPSPTPTVTPSPTALPSITPTPVPLSLVKTAGDAPDGDIYISRIGSAVTFYYRVTNTWYDNLDTIVVSDDNGTPHDPSDDFIVGSISGPVAPGAEYTLQTTRSFVVQHLNTAWARSTAAGLEVSASDDAMVEAWKVVEGNDYNGDWRAYPVTWEFTTGRWSLKRADGMLPEKVYFGTGGDVVASGDYDGDGTTDLAIFRPSSGLWAARYVTRLYFGIDNDMPVPGDYNGDGFAELGIYRRSTGLWAILGISRTYYGGGQDLPIPGDYAGSGTTSIGIFRPSSSLWAIRGMARRYFGAFGAYPAPADYDGDGTRDIGVYRPSSGLWAVNGVTRAYFGTTNDVPQPADYEGSGSAGIAIYRPASSLWAIRGFTRQYWGGLNNIPAN